MTAKRFTVIDHNEWSEGDIIYYDDGKEMGWMDVCDKLNELHEENQQLKKQVPKYKCMTCEYQGYSEIGCLCEKHDCWVDMPYECEDYKELKE